MVAYEPVWAIGTGRAATADDAQETIAVIRATVADLVGQAAADELRIQYGGSVKSSNAEELATKPDVDGALVGGQPGRRRVRPDRQGLGPPPADTLGRRVRCPFPPRSPVRTAR